MLAIALTAFALFGASHESPNNPLYQSFCFLNSESKKCDIGG